MNASPCPHCQAIADPETGRCLCPPAPPAGDGSPELLARAEALFESYLAARVVHARRRAREAKTTFLRDPRNPAKAQMLDAAEREVALLEMQLLEQTRKSRHARGLAPVEKPPAPPAEPRQRDCPRCGACVPGTVADCRCGYAFARSETGAEPMWQGDEKRPLRRGAK